MEIDEIYIEAAKELSPPKCDDDCMIVDAGRAGKVTAEDFEALYNALDKKYRIDGEIAWLLNSHTDFALRMMKTDDKGEYLWNPPMMGTKPVNNKGWLTQLPYATFADIPVIINENAQDIPPRGETAIVAAIVNLPKLIDEGEFDAMVLLRVPRK